VNRGFLTRGRAASHSFYKSDNQAEIIGSEFIANQRTIQ
jgi:hypothetical protein